MKKLRHCHSMYTLMIMALCGCFTYLFITFHVRHSRGKIFIGFWPFWKVQSGYPQSRRAFSMYRSSTRLSVLSEIRDWLLSQSVLTTLNLCSMGWCELKFKYWSVCVGFLYICTFTAPVSFRIINRSKKGNLPSYSISYVNLMLSESSRLFKNLWVPPLTFS